MFKLFPMRLKPHQTYNIICSRLFQQQKGLNLNFRWFSNAGAARELGLLESLGNETVGPARSASGIPVAGGEVGRSMDSPPFAPGGPGPVYQKDNKIAPFVMSSKVLKLLSPDGRYHQFHWRWLRHNCNCLVGCRHDTTGERLVVPLGLTEDRISPANVNVDTSPEGAPLVLNITWMDGHSSTFDVAWLLQHSYAGCTVEAPPAVPMATAERVSIQYEDLVSDDPTGRRQLADTMDLFGFAVLRGAPASEQFTFDLVNDVLRGGVIPSHFGDVEDLKTGNTTNKNTDQLGYTNAAVLPHTDLPMYPDPPTLQLLHCIQKAETGGESIIVDGAAIARHLSASDPLYYWLLCTVPIHFTRVQKEYQQTFVAPLFEVNREDGSLITLRTSYFTMAPFRLPVDLMLPFYDALEKFYSMAFDPKWQFRALLEPGEVVLYNNRRCMHGRLSFTGPRHMRGMYSDLEKTMAYLTKPDADEPVPPTHT